MLGKISRIRRAKSAHARNITKNRFSDKKKLIRDSDSSSTDAMENDNKILYTPLASTNLTMSLNSPLTFINPVVEMEEENL